MQGWTDFTRVLVGTADTLRMNNAFGPPPVGTVGVPQPPQFARTMLLIAEGSANSIVGPLQGGRARKKSQKTASASSKQKAPTTAGPPRAPPVSTPPVMPAPPSSHRTSSIGELRRARAFLHGPIAPAHAPAREIERPAAPVSAAGFCPRLSPPC